MDKLIPSNHGNTMSQIKSSQGRWGKSTAYDLLGISPYDFFPSVRRWLLVGKQNLSKTSEAQHC